MLTQSSLTQMLLQAQGMMVGLQTIFIAFTSNKHILSLLDFFSKYINILITCSSVLCSTVVVLNLLAGKPDEQCLSVGHIQLMVQVQQAPSGCVEGVGGIPAPTWGWGWDVAQPHGGKEGLAQLQGEEGGEEDMAKPHPAQGNSKAQPHLATEEGGVTWSQPVTQGSGFGSGGRWSYLLPPLPCCQTS